MLYRLWAPIRTKYVAEQEASADTAVHRLYDLVLIDSELRISGRLNFDIGKKQAYECNWAMHVCGISCPRRIQLYIFTS